MQSASSQSYPPGSMVVTLLDNEQPRDVLLKALWNPFESRKSLFSPTPNDTDHFCKAENVERLQEENCSLHEQRFCAEQRKVVLNVVGEGSSTEDDPSTI